MSLKINLFGGFYYHRWSTHIKNNNSMEVKIQTLLIWEI
jgi:hypothetical protein